MHAYNDDSGTHHNATAQGYAANAIANAAPSTPTPPPAPSVPAPTASPPAPTPVHVPPGCHPIELVQFWQAPAPLHWALFVRTAATRSGRAADAPPGSAVGNFYELVGTPETYTAQFLHDVTFEPSALAAWRGTHVVGWVRAGQLGVFERAVGEVPVWRGRADWRCQQWVYDVVSAVGGGECPGVCITDGMTFGGLQRHMGRLLEAWESGDI